MLRRLGFAALVVYVLAVLGAAFAPRASGQSKPSGAGAWPASGPAPVPPPTPMVGFAINLHHADDLAPFFRAVDQIHEMGFNSLEVLTPAFQTDGSSEKIRVENEPGRGPSRQQLVDLLNYARRRGLSTTFMPVVLFTDPRGNEWRGKISPEHWDPWWQSYRQAMDYFLGIAIEAGVSNFAVGSELLSTEKNTDRWESLIGDIRQRYRGKLFYSTNWDHYTVPQFWKDLDFIGVSGYWDMTTLSPENDPGDPDSLARRWENIRRHLLEFARDQNRPIFITEVGYPTLPWALKDPWNYVNSSESKPDPQTQAAGYRAFLAGWEDLLTPRRAPATRAAGGTKSLDGYFAGCFFYEWDPYRAGGNDDTGYGVRGKPAFDVLRQFLAHRGFTQTPAASEPARPGSP